MQPLPKNATDCHFHIFGPTDIYPFVEERMYEPRPAPLGDYRCMAEELGFSRMVFVQPTPYGYDNRCLLDAMQTVGMKHCRGVVSLPPDATDADINNMTRLGVRAARLNFVHGVTGPSLNTMKRLADKIASHGWHLEIFTPISFLPDLLEICPSLPVDVVLDHMGSLPPPTGSRHPHLKSLLTFLDKGRGWVKLCGYRTSKIAYPHADIASNARVLIGERAERCLWGSDFWPHANVSYPATTDGLLRLLFNWADNDSDLLRQILSKNPATLYGFEKS